MNRPGCGTRIVALLKDLGDAAAAREVPLVALKGSALHALRLYSPGERPMADIDLLVRPGDGERAAELLASLGYVPGAVTWKHQVFQPAAVANPYEAGAIAPLGEHAANPLKVELHTRITEHLGVRQPDITELVYPEDVRPGLNTYLSTNHLLLHLLLHAAGNLCNRALRLIHLHDIALLTAAMSAQQWDELLSLSPSPKAFWWAFPPLEMLTRYQPGLVPGRVLHHYRRACPWALRRLCHRATLSQQSFASTSLPAFPALAWCVSSAERLRYVRQRLLPDREGLAAREATATEQWAARDPWSRMPQGRRVLKWLFSRPPRRASMYIVELALQQPGP